MTKSCPGSLTIEHSAVQAETEIEMDCCSVFCAVFVLQFYDGFTPFSCTVKWLTKESGGYHQLILGANVALQVPCLHEQSGSCFEKVFVRCIIISYFCTELLETTTVLIYLPCMHRIKPLVCLHCR